MTVPLLACRHEGTTEAEPPPVFAEPDELAGDADDNLPAAAVVDRETDAELSDRLLAAAQRGDLEFVRQLVDVPGINLELRTHTDYSREHATSGYTPLAFAARRGDVEMFELLLERGAKLEPRVLHAAVVSGDLGLVREVLRLGINMPEDVTDAMVQACAELEREIFEYMLSLGAGIDEQGWINNSECSSTCLVQAVSESEGDLDMFEFVVAAGASIDTPDGCGVTPLMTAARVDDPELVERLLALGADIDAEDGGGSRARDLAQEGSDVADLLARKAKNSGRK